MSTALHAMMKKYPLLLLVAVWVVTLHPGHSTGTNTLLYSEDFEGGGGGFFTGGDNPSWEYGAPGPLTGGAQSGANCWATSLDGGYNNQEDGYLTSPAIDLSAHSGGGPLIFSWWQLLATERRFDFASLEVSVDGGGVWERVYGEVSGGEGLAWARQFVMLDASAAVANFRFRFRLRSDTSGRDAGLSIDTLHIRALTHQQVYFEDFESTLSPDGGYVPEGFYSTWEFGSPGGGPGEAYSGDGAWATGLDVFYNSEENSALISPPIDLSAHTDSGFLLSWRQFLSTEASQVAGELFDYVTVEARPTPDAPWERVYGPVSGLVSDRWMRQTVILGAHFAASEVQLRFTLRADPFFESSGFHIDDIEIMTLEGLVAPTITWDVPPNIIAGVPLDASYLMAHASLPGTFTFFPALGTALPEGTDHLLTASFMPEDPFSHASAFVRRRVDVLPGSGSYAAWVSFPPGTDPARTSPGADYDFDGRNNFGEYAFVTDATTPDPAAGPRMIIVESGGDRYPGLEFSVRADDPTLNYCVQVSEQLSVWQTEQLTSDGISWTLSAGRLTLIHSEETSSGIWRLRVRDTLPLAAFGKSFLRVQVSQE